MSFDDAASWHASAHGSWREAAFDRPTAGRHARRDEDYVRRGFWPKVNRVAAGLPFAEDLLAAYYCAFDRDTPVAVKATLIGALAYFVLPFGVVPRIIGPILGAIDDAAVLAGAIRLVSGSITPAHRDAARRALARGLSRHHD